MIRIVFVAGRYRHYNADGTFDLDAMAAEVADERKWVEVIARAGMAWIAPLHNSVMLEDTKPIPDDEYIVRNCEIIRRQRQGIDLICMRPTWDDEPASVGAGREHFTAVEHGLIVVHGEQGTEKVFAYLKELNHA